MIDSIFQMINEENCCRKKARFLCFVFFGINNERWREREWKKICTMLNNTQLLKCSVNDFLTYDYDHWAFFARKLNQFCLFSLCYKIDKRVTFGFPILFECVCIIDRMDWYEWNFFLSVLHSQEAKRGIHSYGDEMKIN